MTTKLQQAPGVSWLIVIFACACNVLSVAGLHYEQYVYYVVRLNEKPSPWISFYSVMNEIIFLCPAVVVLLARQSAPIVVAYASVLFLILAGSVYLLIPSSITGIDGPSIPLDTPTIILYLVGILSGLGVIVVWAIVLASLFFDWVNNHSGGG